MRERLAQTGIGTQIHYPIPVHLQKPYAGNARTTSAYSVTEAAAAEVLSLLLYPELDQETVSHVAGMLGRVTGECA